MSDSVQPHRRQPTRLPVPGILQARILEWVATSFSNAWKWKVKVKSLSRIQLLATPWTAAYQAPPSMGFSRQEYWSGVPLPSPQSNRAVAFKFLHHYCFSKEQRNTFLNFLIKIYYNKYLSSLCVCVCVYIYIHTHIHTHYNHMFMNRDPLKDHKPM